MAPAIVKVEATTTKGSRRALVLFAVAGIIGAPRRITMYPGRRAFFDFGSETCQFQLAADAARPPARAPNRAPLPVRMCCGSCRCARRIRNRDHVLAIYSGTQTLPPSRSSRPSLISFSFSFSFSF